MSAAIAGACAGDRCISLDHQLDEAQQLLEVAEPAWQYDTYNKMWELMAEDQQLEARLSNLEIKVGR
jgi:hypothetical protein